ncbi:MAG TPA: MarR family transcriptional regulator, partial [Lysinibacillus sp.]|nr:MarR family transcriptional regulator [Lysinibacillus sp.]
PAITVTILAFEEEMVGSLTVEEQQQFLKLLEKMKG